MRRLAPLLLLPLAACKTEEGPPPGSFGWEVTLTGIEDLCNPGDPQPYQETFTYSLVFDGSLTEIYIGGDSFAAGIMSGCSLEYDSPVVGERRGGNDEFWVKWQIAGEAVLRQGGQACELDEGIDWQGEETFEVLETDDPSLPVGCTYTLSAEGVYVGENA